MTNIVALKAVNAHRWANMHLRAAPPLNRNFSGFESKDNADGRLSRFRVRIALYSK